jgi:hypothetical protein
MNNKPTPDTDVFAAYRQTHQGWEAHSKRLERERDEARELARELRDALRLTLTSLIGRMVPKDTDTVECAHAAITKAKEALP